MNKLSNFPNSTEVSTFSKKIQKYTFSNDDRQVMNDLVVIERPLQIKLYWFENEKLKSNVFSITMRTPGNEAELIVGMLITEGVINSIENIEELNVEDHEENLWEVKLIVGFVPDLKSIDRYQLNYSSCGLCGTTSLKSLELKNPTPLNTEIEWLSVKHIYQMPDCIFKHQSIFKETGGVHAAALFSDDYKLLDIKEDIGRHNAVDKLIGSILKSPNNVSISKSVLIVSSRVSFEIVQKTVMAGIPVLAAIGAPTDLAISAAKRFNLTLIGFSTNKSFNLYNGQWRLTPMIED